jgi:hypothetical protein
MTYALEHFDALRSVQGVGIALLVFLALKLWSNPQ